MSILKLIVNLSQGDADLLQRFEPKWQDLSGRVRLQFIRGRQDRWASTHSVLSSGHLGVHSTPFLPVSQPGYFGREYRRWRLPAFGAVAAGNLLLIRPASRLNPWMLRLARWLTGDILPTNLVASAPPLPTLMACLRDYASELSLRDSTLLPFGNDITTSNAAIFGTSSTMMSDGSGVALNQLDSGEPGNFAAGANRASLLPVRRLGIRSLRPRPPLA